MRVGDRVEMKKGALPKTKFRTGVVLKVGAQWTNSVSIKRDGYKGHEYTWWSKSNWKVIWERDQER